MYNGMLIQDLDIKDVSSERRNPILANVMAQLDYMEKRGSGLSRICNETKALEGYKDELKPVFKSTPTQFQTVILAFAFQNTHILQSSKVSFDGALTHRQRLRHLFAGDCRRLFDEIEDFLLTLSEFRFRHVSVMVSDIRGVGRCKDDGLELGWSRFELGS